MRPSRILLLAALVAPTAGSYFSSVFSSAPAAGPPNVLILLVDDLGYGDIGAYGNTTIKTPNIDRLASEGVRMTQHLVASPICTPSRASLLTGRHAVRLGLTGSKVARVMSSPATPGGISLDETTIASMLRARGYATGMVGKWHVGMGVNCSHCPLAHGFDSYWGMPVTNVQACGQRAEWVTQASMLHFIFEQYPAGLILRTCLVLLAASCALVLVGRLSPRSLLLHACLAAALLYTVYFIPSTIMLLSPKACVLFEGDSVIEQPVQLKYLTHRETHHATRFIESHAGGHPEKPFFLFMSYTKVHTALSVADERAGASAHGAYGDNVEEMDWSVGELLGTLDRLGLARDTFVYFSSDNGPWRESGDEGGSCGFSPADPAHEFKGSKAQTWECGIRVPGIIRWPAKYAARVEHAATSNLDILPTLAAIAGAPVPPHAADRAYAPAPAGVVDGRDLSPLLEGRLAPGEGVHDFLFHYCDTTLAAVRLGRYKAHFATAAWEDEGAQTCPRGLICKCAAVPHDPPLLFDIEADPAELRPIEPGADADADAAVGRMREAKARQEGSVIPVPSQTELRPEVGNFPCCGYPHPGWRRILAVLTNRCGC